MIVAPLGWPFGKFQHVCMYVRDLPATEAYLAGLGIQLQPYAHMTEGKFLLLEGMDEEAFWALGYKHAMVGDIHFQVMSPGSHDTLLKRLVDQHGDRIYTCGWVVDDVDAAEQEMLSRGLSVKWKGRHENGWGFTYFDTFDKLGAYFCIRQNPRP
jgi:methylmalonyl-CoA/ethylmalonyl-CoA epimerase